MRILHLNEQRGWGGGEQQVSYLIGGLARLGVESVLAGRRGASVLENKHHVDRLELITLPFLGQWDLYTAWAVADAVVKFGIDIIHAHTSHTHTIACLARYKAERARVVVTRRVAAAPRMSLLSRWKYGRPDRIIAVSSSVARILHDFGVQDERLRMVHSGVDPNRMKVEALDLSELGVPRDALILGNVASLVEYKDHATLIEAFALAADRLQALHLVIAGDGELRESIERDIERRGLAHRVHLLGYRSDVPRVMKAFDAFVLSSKCEGLGTSILDAWACECPVIATDAGGIPDLVQDGKTGLLVPLEDPARLADAVIRLFRSPGLAETVKSGALERLNREFTADGMVKRTKAVYEELVG